MRNKFFKNMNGHLEHPYFGESKKTISTTIPLSCYEFAKSSNLKFSECLAGAINEVMSGEAPKKEIMSNLQILSGRYQRLINYMKKTLGEEMADKIIEDAESTGRILERAQKEKA